MNVHVKHDEASAVLVRRELCPSLAVDALSVLPWPERMQAHTDFDMALASWNIARHARRGGDWHWRLDIRAALRAWEHYSRAVRKAQNMRTAA